MCRAFITNANLALGLEPSANLSLKADHPPSVFFGLILGLWRVCRLSSGVSDFGHRASPLRQNYRVDAVGLAHVPRLAVGQGLALISQLAATPTRSASDTYAWIWWVDEAPRLPKKTRPWSDGQHTSSVAAHLG